jgi:hypothetical protein
MAEIFDINQILRDRKEKEELFSEKMKKWRPIFEESERIFQDHDQPIKWTLSITYKEGEEKKTEDNLMVSEMGGWMGMITFSDVHGKRSSITCLLKNIIDIEKIAFSGEPITRKPKLNR